MKHIKFKIGVGHILLPYSNNQNKKSPMEATTELLIFEKKYPKSEQQI